MRTLTRDELHAEATAAFGDKPIDWKFRCPNCGDVANGRDFIDAGVVEKLVERVGQECIGRHLGALGSPSTNTRGCNWAAYGLLPGPWRVVIPAEGDRAEKVIFSFELASS